MPRVTKAERKAEDENLETITESAFLTRVCLPVNVCPVCGGRLFEIEDGALECDTCEYCSEH